MLNHKTIKTKQSQTYITLHTQYNVDVQTRPVRGIKKYVIDNTTQRWK